MPNVFQLYSGPQAWFKLNVNQPRRDWDHSRILELNWLWNHQVKDYPFLCEIDYVDFKEFI